MLGGIGFTMSLFIANLAFGDPAALADAKLAVLATSVVAGVAGWAFLRFALARGWSGKWLALAIGGLLSGWGPVIVWLGWPLVFNRMVAARIGSPLYNNHAGLLTLAGAVAFTLSLAAIFNLIERMPRSVPTAGEPSRSVSR